TTCDAAQNLTNAEDFEAVFVQINRARIVEERDAGESFLIATPAGAPTDTFLVSNSNNAYTFNPDSNKVITVRGMLTFRNGGFPFRILPRGNYDIFPVTGAGVEEPLSDAISLAVSPNPARSARITFALPKEAEVDLGVFDLAGRRIETLAHGTLQAGPHSRDWNGTVAAGKVRAGMYFYKLRVGTEV